MGGQALAILANEKGAAANAVDRALELNPNSAQAWNSRGWIWVFIGQPEPAIKAFENALRLSPTTRCAGPFGAVSPLPMPWPVPSTWHSNPRTAVCMRNGASCLRSASKW
jgi:tetratricopeptide (TPR) repeat protein